MKESKNIVFFDGPCDLCNSTVRFLIKNDPQGKLIYSSLQSEFANRFFLRENIKNDFDTIIFYSGSKVYKKAIAIQRMLAFLNLKCRIISLVLKFIPTFIKNMVYDFVSRHRFVISKKTNFCALLPIEARERVKIH